MWKRNKRRGLSVFLAAILCIGALQTNFITGSAEDATLFEDVVTSDFRKVTLSDCQVADTDRTTDDVDFYLVSEADKQNDVAQIDKTAFSAYTVFKNTTGSGKGTALHILTQEGEDTGLALTIESKNGKALALKKMSNPAPSFSKKTFSATTAGLSTDTFNGTLFLLQITMEIVDSDNDGDQDDLKLGVFFNSKLYDNEYLYVRNIKTKSYKTGTRMNYQGEAGEVYSYYPEVAFATTSEKEFEWKSLADCDLEEGSTSGIAGSIQTETLSGTVFNLKTTFKGNATDSTRLHFATTGTDTNDGFVLYSDGKNLRFGLVGATEEYLLNAQIAKFSTNTVLNEQFKLRISTEFVNHDNGTEKNDLKIGLFINEYLYNGVYFYFDNVDASRIGTCFYFDGVAGEVSSLLPPITIENSDSADFELITISDFGIANGKGDASGALGRSLNRTLLGMKVKFTANQSRLHYGPNTSSYSGVGVRMDTGNLVVSCEAGSAEEKLTNLQAFTIKPDEVDFEYDTFEDKEFILHISCEFGDFDNEGDGEDIKLGIFINHILYKSEYVFIYDQADRLTDKLNFNESRGQGSFASIETAPKPLPEGLKAITLTDARIGIGSGNHKGQFVTIDSLDGTLFSAMLRFNKNGSRMHLGLNNDVKDNYIGIGVRLDGDDIVIGNEMGTAEGALSNMKLSHIKITPDMVGYKDSFVDKEFLLQMSIEFVDQNKNGAEDDIKLGVFVNGKMIANNYFYILDQAMLLGTRINFNEGGAASYAPYESALPDLGQKAYEELTARDFMFVDRTYTKTSTMRTYDFNSLGGKAFSANLTFSEEKAGEYAMYLGGDMWSGLRVEVRANGKLRFSHVHNDGAQTIIAEVLPEEVGMKTFFDTKVNLRVTFDVVDGEKDFVNYRLGIYINDKQYNDSYYWVKHVDKSALTETMFIYTQTGGTLGVESTNPKVDLSIFGVK